jgi:phosphatidylethanolamine/phosphatidyl-N-methylethanolamine N-methyltransferase
MKNYLKTAVAFTKKFGTTGAISETSRFVEQEITEFVKTNTPQTIVEFGAGHGNITQMILSKMHPDSTLYAFELEAEFIPLLQLIQDKRLHIVHDSADNILHKVKPHSVDVVVSSIPFTIIPKEIGFSILSKTREALKPGGSFHQVLYSIQIGRFEKHFSEVKIKPVLNFPVAFIHHCKK